MLSLARSGASSPRTLARSVGLGFAIGLCPAVGAPMLILVGVLAASRLLQKKRTFLSVVSLPPPPALNAPALLVGNAISLPAELLMLGPYLKAGRFLREAFGGGAGGTGGGGGGAGGSGSSSGGGGGGAAAAALVAAAKEHARRSLPAALFVWALSVPLVCAGVAALLEPWLARAVSLTSSSSSSSSASAGTHRAATADVELAPLVNEGGATTTT